MCLLHLSDTTRNKWEHTPLGKGHIDSMSFLTAAKRINFDGYLSLEVISPEGIQGIDSSVKSLLDMGWTFENVKAGGWNA